jgi:hypothetical protein
VLPSAMQRKPPISLACSRRGPIERRVAGSRAVTVGDGPMAGNTARVWHRALERRGSLAHLGLAARLVLPSAMQRKPPISLASSRRGSIERRVAGARGVCLQLVWATSDTFGQAHGSSCCVDRRLQDGPRHGIQRQGVRTAQFGRAQPRQIERAWTCSW